MSQGFVADACALIAFYHGANRPLSRVAHEVIESGAVSVSAVTVWEITRKTSLGKLPPVPGVTAGGFVEFLQGEGYRLLPLSPEAAERANSLPPHHADPMDRLLIATALAERLTVVTSDRSFARYGVETLW